MKSRMKDPSIYRTKAGAAEVMQLYNSPLAQWPVASSQISIPTRHGATFVIASGEPANPAVLLLHGSGSNSAVWTSDIAAYSRCFRVYAVDLLGEPGKSSSNRPPWNGAPYEEWLEDVLDGLKIDNASLVGFSQGGWTALKFAVSRPERVRSLALLTPGGIAPDRWSFALTAITLSMLGRPGIQRINSMLLAGHVVAPEVENAMTLIASNFRPRIGRLPIFADAELKRLTMPVLLITGTQDCLRDGERIAARLRQLVPHLAAISIQGGGHALLDTAAFVLPFLLGQISSERPGRGPSRPT